MVMPKYFKTVGTKVSAETHDAFLRHCVDTESSMHKEIKDFIEGVIEEDKKVERTGEEGLERGSQGNIPGGSGGVAEGPAKEWGDCPFC